jgi:ATP-binding cassette subfamily B protein
MSARSVLLRFWPHTRADRPRLVAAAALLVAAAGCDAAVVWMFTSIIDGALSEGRLSALWAPAALWAALIVVGGGLTTSGGWILAGAAERFVLRLRRAVFAHLQRLGPDFHQRYSTGDLVSRLTSDIDEVEALVSSGLVSTVTAGCTVAFFSVAAVAVRWQLAGVVLVLLPLLWLATRLVGRFTKTAARDERQAAGAVGAIVEQALVNLPLVQAYGTESVEADKMRAESDSWRRARIRESRLSAVYGPVTDLLEGAGILAVLCVGAIFISRGQLTVGGLLGFAAYLGYLYPPLSQLGHLSLTVAAATASSARLVELLDTAPAVTDTPGALDVPARHGHLELRDVTFRYPGSKNSGLRAMTLTVHPGELVLITGASGAGKSTLTKLLLRMFDPDAGSVLLDGLDLRARTLAAVRASITLLPQEPMLFDATIAENIAYGTPAATKPQIAAAARAAGAEEFILYLPHRYDTRVAERGATLSGGQRQRITIARALLRNSPVLVLDEPTTGLGDHAAEALLTALRHLARGRTTLVVSHDLRLAPHADTIIVLDHGTLTQHGTHHNLLTAPGPIRDGMMH